MLSKPHPENVPILRNHRRQWRSCVYVYPVVSRRSRGLSIGVNLNTDQSCNFSCLYCQVERGPSQKLGPLRLEILHDELHMALEEALTGRLWNQRPFAGTPMELRRINDIALSGDGEPTCVGDFDRAVAAAAEAKRQVGRDDVKLVVITNASMLDRGPFQRALPILDAHNGEIWAKLDAGTEACFRQINRPQGSVTLKKIAGDIADVARGRPVVIQTLLFRLDGQSPPPEEIAAYIDRLRGILAVGGMIKLVQLHTIARSPASASVAVMPEEELQAIGEQVRAALQRVPVAVYPGADVSPQKTAK